MENSNEKALDILTRHYNNSYALMIAFQKATAENNIQPVEVELMDENGNMETVTVNAIQNLYSSVERIDQNYQSLMNTDNISYIINGDGSMSQVLKTTFMNNEYLKNFTVGDVGSVDIENNIKKLVFPSVRLPITIDSTVKTPILCKVFEVFDGFDEIKENPELIDIRYYIDQGIISVTEEYEQTLELQKERVETYGIYTVTDSETNGDEATVFLNKTKYRTINSQVDNMELVVGDMLATTNGTTVYEIIDIHAFSKKLKLKRIKGIGHVTVGEDKLSLNAKVISTGNNVVGVPITPQKKLIIFLSTKNTNTIGFPSTGIKLDTSTYKVTVNNITYSLDEYFNQYVINISDYLTSLAKESSIPISLGITPQKPKLIIENFKVIQINKHLTDSKASKSLDNINKQKEKLKNEIDYKQSEIAKIQNDIDTKKYHSVAEKTKNQEAIINLRTEVNILNQSLLTVTRDLDNNAIQYGLKASKPKYRVIGFWDIQKPMFSPSTPPQHVIKYEVQYRYLSLNLDTTDAPSYVMVNDEGKEINVTISPWNNYDSEVLTKVQNINGELTWESIDPDSSDVININQLNISINEGESIQIRLRAISEAGYPLAPLKSEWSDIIRVDFPEGLIENALNSIVNKNEQDLKKQEFNNLLQQSGLLRHVSGEIMEADKLFFHKTSDIASGFYTEEMKIIPLDSFLQQLDNKLNNLIDKNINEQVSVEIIDFNNEKISVFNNSTIELSAGNYSDKINLLDKDKYGEIIRKQGFIKIVNKNDKPIEIKTLVPGPIINDKTAPKYYNVPVRMPEGLKQNSKQVIYFRNNDITGQSEEAFVLIKPHGPKTTTIINPKYIDPKANEDAKNIVYREKDGSIKLVALLSNAGNDFVAFTKDHPLFDTENLNTIKPEFERIELMTNNLKKEKFQEEPFIGTEAINSIGFADNDKFAVGANTCGAYLYPVINNVNTVSVIGNTTISTLIINKDSEIMIPFVYEYRMMDAVGTINGNRDLTINDDVIYSKTIGIDMLLGMETFRFDITTTSKLKSSVQSIDSINVSSIVAGFSNEEKEKLK